MKYLIFLLCIFLSSCASIKKHVKINKLDKHDIVLMTALFVVSCIDWDQTRNIIDDPDRMESNPNIGNSKQNAFVFTIGSGVALSTVSLFLPNKIRKTVLAYKVGVHTQCVIHNSR